MRSRRSFLARSTAFLASLPFLFRAAEVRGRGFDSFNSEKYNNRMLVIGEKSPSMCLHAMLEHCYENDDALALVLAKSTNPKDGILSEVDSLLKKQNSIMGFDGVVSKVDPMTHDRYAHVRNRNGGWSKILFIKIHDDAGCLMRRMISLSPSFIYHHDATKTQNDDRFFTRVVTQLGRRQKIVGPQLYYASGPRLATADHWTNTAIKGFVQAV